MSAIQKGKLQQIGNKLKKVMRQLNMASKHLKEPVGERKHKMIKGTAL